MSPSCSNHWESNDDSFLHNAPLDSLTSPNPTHPAAKRLLEDGTVVTKETHDQDGEGFDSTLEDAESEQFIEEEYDSDSDSEISMYAIDNGVPAEVNLSFHENDNDNESDSEPSDAEESEEELDDAEDESEEEDHDDGDSIDHDSVDEYETDEDSVESEGSSEDDEGDDLMDDSSCCSAANTQTDNHYHCDDSSLGNASQHELFLPFDVTPSTQSLKCEEEDDDSSDEEEDVVPHYSHRTYMMGNGHSGRPRMWDGCPSSISISSNSSSSAESCQESRASKCGSKKSGKKGVSFNSSVTVYPVFETTVYSDSMVQGMFTKRDELRVNKLRNKCEFAYDLHDWRNATEEEEMEPNDLGELVHPVHFEKSTPASPKPCQKRNVVQTYSSSLGGYTIGRMNSSGVVHRAKRMRMYYP
mmetsp:Transcript_9516/g.20073  ORF Transcript_9516/g.20073 Transcript_9516/m.20073 type:complete len:414 (-) Transcript_9516:479-1720(-)